MVVANLWPMDFILNELSLDGQYRDIDHFATHGVRLLTEVLQELRVLNVSPLLKKSVLYDRPVTTSASFYEVIYSSESRINDSLRRMKGLMASLMNEPYWDTDQRQNPDARYWMLCGAIKEDVSGSSVAEAQARHACLVSFVPSAFQTDSMSVEVEGENDTFLVDNVWCKNQARDILLRSKAIGYDAYFRGRYRKIDFGGISSKNGFNLITPTNIDLFKEAFYKFDSLSWEDILGYPGLDYKRFHKNSNTQECFTPEQWRMDIFKFRVSEKIRCFGYREKDTFFVLRIDLEHKLSDKG